MEKPEPLTYRELIAPYRKVSPPILTPSDIPVHPAIYDSDFAYTPDFVREVVSKVPESMREDYKTIMDVFGEEDARKIFGRDFSITDSAVTVNGWRTVSYSDFSFSANSEKRGVGAHLAATNCAIAPHIKMEVALLSKPVDF